jgi:hypothetical protein
MNDEKTKSTVPATKRTSTPRWKRLHFKSRIVLMLLAAIAVIVYLLRSGLAKQYEGLGAALCAVACGGFLVWHVIHLFAEQDELQERQLRENQTNPTTPPPESE